MRREPTMRDARRRLEKVEAQVNALFPPPPTPEEQAAKQEAWNALVKRWLTRLTDSMDRAHDYLLQAWIEDFRQPCQHDPCPVPPGLRDHINILWGWKRDESKPISLPAPIVEAYLSGDAHQQLNTRPHLDCERCASPIPVLFFFVPGKQHCPFEQCPVCGCHTLGWHAYDIAQGNPGYQNLKPYSQRD
jgi:hypothetical protein